MFVYRPHHPVDHSELVNPGGPADLEGKILDEDPLITARIAHRTGAVTAEVSQATTGVIEVTFPFTEHATAIDGEVTITDAAGTRRTYRPGHSYVIEHDAVVRWEIRRRRVYAPTLDGWTA